MAQILNVTEDEYHADPCASPSLSQSIAHILVTQSPRHAWLAHPRLGGADKPRTGTRAMDDGAILHRFLLGQGAAFELVKFDDWRKNDAKAEKARILAENKIPLLAKDFERLVVAAERVAKNAESQGFPLSGVPELAVEFTEKGAQSEVLCRCKFDLVRSDHVLYDLKKVRSANPIDIERTIVEYGMDIQRAAYTHAYEQLRPEAQGRSDFVFLFCEIEPPYEVVPARLDGMLREIGERRWRKAVWLWEKLLIEGSWPWPGYTDGAVTLTAPAWVVNRELPEGFYG